MKKVNFLFVLIGIISLPFFNSCTTDEATPPTILIAEQPGATYVPGTYVDYVLNLSSNADLVSLYIEESTLSEPASEILTTVPTDALDENFDFASNLTSVQLTYRYHIPTTITEGSTLSISFEVEDKDATGTESVQITVTSGSNEINSFTAVLMGGQQNVTTGSFLDANTGTVYLQADAVLNQDKVDIVYYYGFFTPSANMLRNVSIYQLYQLAVINKNTNCVNVRQVRL